MGRSFPVILCPQCEGSTYQLFYNIKIEKKKSARIPINRKYCSKCDIIIRLKV